MKRSSTVKATTNPAASKALKPLPATFFKSISGWRGYKSDVLQELNQRDLFGLHDGYPAFSIRDASGQEIGRHVRKYNGHSSVKTKNDWFIDPPGIPLLPLIIGELTKATREIHFFESDWDGIALLDALRFDSKRVVVITHGAGNTEHLKNLLPLPRRAKLFVWPQKDEAGKRWLANVPYVVNRSVNVCGINGATDLNNL